MIEEDIAEHWELIGSVVFTYRRKLCFFPKMFNVYSSPPLTAVYYRKWPANRRRLFTSLLVDLKAQVEGGDAAMILSKAQLFWDTLYLLVMYVYYLLMSK